MPRRLQAGNAALLLLLLAACAPAEPVTAPAPAAGTAPAALPPGEVRWTVTTRPAMDLWYHGLAYTGYLGPAGEIPIYPTGYVERMATAKRAAGVHPTVLDRRAEEFRATFEAGPRYGALHFLPLYFPSGEAFFAALRTWIQAGGDARRVQDPAIAQQVAFLSQQLPTDAERRTIAGWLEVLTEEGRVFYTAHRQQEGARLAAVPPAVQAEWDRLAPRLRPVLDFLLVNQGEVILSPALGPEGRTIDLGRRFNRVAVLMPEADRPADGVWAALHEMLYPFVNGVIDDQLSPAQLRDVDRQQLGRRAAIRTAALVLAQVAPDALPAYREAHLRWVGAAVPTGAAERERAFIQAFPLPEPLPQSLAQAVANIGPGF